MGLHFYGLTELDGPELKYQKKKKNQNRISHGTVTFTRYCRVWQWHHFYFEFHGAVWSTQWYMRLGFGFEYWLGDKEEVDGA